MRSRDPMLTEIHRIKCYNEFEFLNILYAKSDCIDLTQNNEYPYTAA